MNIPFHIFKKDLRHTRILISLWLAMVLVQFSLVAIGVNPSDQVMQAVYAAVGFLIPLLTALVVIVIVPLVVHGEPLVGTTAFWFTRPVERPTLLCAKAFYALALVSVPLVVELVVLAVNGATLRQLALAFPEILMGSLSLVLSVAVLAALTPNFGMFAIAGAILMVSMIIISVSISLGQLFLHPERMMRAAQDFSLMKSRATMGSVAMILLAGVVLVHQFLTRRTARTIVGASVALVLVVLTQSFWPWDFLKPSLPMSVPVAFDVAGVKVGLYGSINVNDVSSMRGGEKTPKKNISAAVSTTGIPPEYVVRVNNVSAKLTAPGGEALVVGENQPSYYMEPKADAAEAALHGTPIINANSRYVTASTSLFVIGADTYSRYAAKPLGLSATLDILVSQYKVMVALPLKKGAAYDKNSTHLVITDILQQPDGVEILLRERKLNLLFDRKNGESPIPGMDRLTVLYVLRNTRRNEAIISKRNTNIEMNIFNQGILVNKPLRLDFGPEDNNSGPLFPRINQEWLADAELVRLELVPVAEFSKQFTDDAFQLDGRGANWKHSGGNEMRKADVAALAKISLPEHPTDEQVSEYIRAIVIASRQQYSFHDKDPQIAMFAKVGPAHLDLLIAAMDESNYSNVVSYLEKAISSLAREEDKKIILDALATHPRLVEVVVKKGWQQDARDTLIFKLGDEKANLSPDWIKAVVDLNDPASYEPLKKYFLRDRNQDNTYKIISQLPNIDLAPEVDIAWKKAKFGRDHEVAHMLFPAADQGHADALEAAVRILQKTDNKDNSVRRQAKDALLKFTVATGDEAALIAWYEANKSRLAFDPQAKKFLAKP